MKDRKQLELERAVDKASQTMDFKYDLGIPSEIERADRALNEAHKNLADYLKTRGANMNKTAVAQELVRIAKSLVGGAKEYFLMTGIGSSKYVVNFHDGVKTHPDGSEFYDIRIFRNRPAAEAFMSELVSKGYKYGKQTIYK